MLQSVNLRPQRKRQLSGSAHGASRCSRVDLVQVSPGAQDELLPGLSDVCLPPAPLALCSFPRVDSSRASFGQFGLVKRGPCLRSGAAPSLSYLQRIRRHVPRTSWWLHPEPDGGGGPAYREGHAPARTRPLSAEWLLAPSPRWRPGMGGDDGAVPISGRRDLHLRRRGRRAKALTRWSNLPLQT